MAGEAQAAEVALATLYDLPLAIGAYFLLSIFVSISAVSLLRDESGLFLLLILTIGATIFLHLNTGQRLVEIAAEE